MRRCALWLIASLISASPHASTLGEFQITPRFVIGTATVKDELAEPMRGESFVFGGGFGFAYVAPFHLSLEAGLQFQEEQVPFSDSQFTIAEFYVQAGLDIPLADGWHLCPKFGRTFADLIPENQQFDAAGMSLNGIARRGRISDAYELAIRKYISESFALGLALRDFLLPDGTRVRLGSS